MVALAVAARIDCGILTCDKGLKRCIQVLGSEGLMRQRLGFARGSTVWFLLRSATRSPSCGNG
jgi:hypothetical protein